MKNISNSFEAKAKKLKDAFELACPLIIRGLLKRSKLNANFFTMVRYRVSIIKT